MNFFWVRVLPQQWLAHTTAPEVDPIDRPARIGDQRCHDVGAERCKRVAYRSSARVAAATFVVLGAELGAAGTKARCASCFPRACTAWLRKTTASAWCISVKVFWDGVGDAFWEITSGFG